MLPNRVGRSVNQQGQALIIILLTMSVVLTVVLSSVSRSVTEVSVSSFEEESLRAFSAAEAGVEEKLLDIGIADGVPQPTVALLNSSASYQVTVSEHNISNASGKKLTYPKLISSGETATFFASSINENNQFICDDIDNPCVESNNIWVCYGDMDSATTPAAIELSVYYDPTFKSVAIPNNYMDMKVYRMVLDNDGRIPGAETASVDACDYDDDGDSEFKYRAAIDLNEEPIECTDPGCILAVKARILYAQDQPIGFWTNSITIPGQGILISSTGVAGGSSRKVEVYRTHPEVYDVFDNAVFSRNGLTK